MQYSDQPISRPDQDLLGRSSFALTLARSIDALVTARQGFVIGIAGEWGSGKTSAIRLICRYLRHIEMERASRYSLNWELAPVPRSIAELEAMSLIYERVEPHLAALEAAYKNIGRASRDARWAELRRCLDSDSEADIADRYWRLKNQIDQNPHTTIVHFSPWLIAGRAELASALLGDLARVLGDRFGEDVTSAFGALLERLSELAPVAGAGLDLAMPGIEAVFRAGGTWSNKIAKRLTSGPTLDQLRQRLRDALTALPNQQILVVIDDLDRLTPGEALEMVSVVKSLGDLPNVIYLLSFEEEKLESLIKTAIDIDGREYLAKIIQYQVHLPPIDQADLSRMVDGELGLALGDVSEEEQTRLSFAWTYVLGTYLRTPRDVRRLVNTIAVARSGLADHTDAVDLLLLEALRLFEPSVYHHVRENILTLAR